ncbi:DUF3347 domain-containing protein [Aquimarina brevivitae]|nr:DUF3347 domain-containing protein [Aquimarina brevivitae]
MKKTVVQLTMIFAAAILIISCGQDKKTETKESQETTEEKPAEVVIQPMADLDVTDASTDVKFANESVNAIYINYLRVKAALVNSDNALTMKTGSQLFDAIPEDEATKELKATAELLSVTKEIKKQRDFFVTLTDEVEKLIKNEEITSGEVYKQFCPMAFEGQGGFWLSNSKEIRNPYYGDKMLKCGSVKETIK